MEGERLSAALRDRGEAVRAVSALTECTPEVCERETGCGACRACGICREPSNCQVANRNRIDVSRGKLLALI